jgi:DNA-binding SARP family transcriptional activator/tetratricopeptide (TPR) repeat protein
VVDFLLLGPVEVRSGAAHLQLSSQRQRAVLAALLLTPNVVVAPHRLVALVWGDAAPASAVANLRTHVSQLRRQLASLGGGNPRIQARAGGYLIDIRGDEVDISRFERLAEAGRRAQLLDDDERAAELFGATLRLWRGAPLANLRPTAAIDAEVQRLNERRLAVIEQHCHSRLHLGAHAEVVGDLRRLVADYPLHERLRALLLTALAGAGQQTAALTEYETFRRHLVHELGAEPGQELRDAHVAILRQADKPSSTVTPAQLPRAAGEFCGRAAELRSLDQLLDSTGSPRLMALVGTAGVGKTALATQWGHRMRDRFPDGQLYADLRDIDDPMSVLARFLRALGIQPQRIPHEITEAAALYRSVLAAKTLLCVLDNATEPSQVRPLLPAAPNCVTVVTSRNRLDGLVALDGADRITVDVLTPDDAFTLIAAAVGGDRAAAEPTAVAELAKTCAYLPLALRITGAQLGLRTGRRIVEHVGDLRERGVLDGLTVDGDSSAVRAAYDLSYHALGTESRRTLRLLGLVPGPDFTREAAAALTESTVAVAALELDRLAAGHLIHEHAAGRYRMHDLVRRYAAERAHIDDTERDRDAAISGLFAYYLDRADEATDRVAPLVLRMPRPRSGRNSFDTDIAARAWLRDEGLNLAAAVRHAHESGYHVMTWQLVDALRGYCCAGSFLPEALELAQLSLGAAESSSRKDARAAAHNNLAAEHAVRCHIDAAAEHFQFALSLYRELGHQRGGTIALQNLAALRLSTGELDAADAAFTEAAAFDPRPNRICEQNLAVLYEYRGQLAEAAAIHARQLAEDRAPSTLLLFARVAHRARENVTALRSAEDALSTARGDGDQCTEAHALALLALIHSDRDSFDLASGAAEAAMRLAADVNEPSTVIASHAALAATCRRSGDRGRARRLYQRALGLARQAHARFDECEILLGLSCTEFADGDQARGDTYLCAASALAEERGFHGLRTYAAQLVPELETL